MSFSINDSRFHGPYPLGVVIKMWGSMVQENPHLFPDINFTGSNLDIEKPVQQNTQEHPLCLQDVCFRNKSSLNDIT